MREHLCANARDHFLKGRILPHQATKTDPHFVLSCEWASGLLGLLMLTYGLARRVPRRDPVVLLNSGDGCMICRWTLS